MEEPGANRNVVYPEFKDLEWRVDVPTSSMYDKVPGKPQYSVKITYTEGDGKEGCKWLTLDHEGAAALLQDVQGAIFSLTAPHTRRIARIVK